MVLSYIDERLTNIDEPKMFTVYHTKVKTQGCRKVFKCVVNKTTLYYMVAQGQEFIGFGSVRAKTM